jgi:hypothetical protein
MPQLLDPYPQVAAAANTQIPDHAATTPPESSGQPKPAPTREPASASRWVPGSLHVRDRRSRQRTSPVCSQPPATRWCRSSLLRRAGDVKLSSRPTTPVSCRHVVLFCWPVVAVSLVMLQSISLYPNVWNFELCEQGTELNFTYIFDFRTDFKLCRYTKGAVYNSISVYYAVASMTREKAETDRTGPFLTVPSPMQSVLSCMLRGGCTQKWKASTPIVVARSPASITACLHQTRYAYAAAIDLPMHAEANKRWGVSSVFRSVVTHPSIHPYAQSFIDGRNVSCVVEFSFICCLRTRIHSF